MPRPGKKPRVDVDALELTSIAKAEDPGLARDCLRLLSDNEISARIKSKEGPKGTENITIEVDSSRFNEAYMLIESKISLEGFFDIYTETAQTKEDPYKAA